jgi:uncharacterized cupin superfamily protein
MAEKERVELFPAHSFICPGCGEMQYAPAEIVEFNEEERLDLIEKHPDQDFKTGEWLSTPDTVTCLVCDREFEVSSSWMS